MKSKKLNLIEDLAGRFFFAIFYALMTFVWVYMILDGFNVSYTQDLLWIFVIAIVAGSLIHRWNNRLPYRVSSKLKALAVFVGVGLLLTLMGSFSRAPGQIELFTGFQWGLIFMTLYLLLGMIRYPRVTGHSSHFMSDLIFGFVVMLLTIYLKGGLSIFTTYHVLLFFLSGVAFAIYRGYLLVRGTKGDLNSSWAAIAGGVVIFISAISVIFTYGFSMRTLRFLLLPVTLLLRLLEKIFDIVVYSLAYLLTPLIIWLLNFLKKNANELPSRESLFEDVPELSEQVRQMAPKQTPDYFYTFMKAMIVIGVISLVIYFIMKKRSDKEIEKSYEEVRESIFNVAEFEKDISNFIDSVKSRFRKKKSKPSIYDGSGNLIRVREIYYKLIKRFNKLIPFQSNYTPHEFLFRLTDRYSEQSGPLEIITKIYEKARYNREVSDLEVEEITQKYQQVEEEILDKKDNT